MPKQGTIPKLPELTIIPNKRLTPIKAKLCINLQINMPQTNLKPEQATNTPTQTNIQNNQTLAINNKIHSIQNYYN